MKERPGNLAIHIQYNEKHAKKIRVRTRETISKIKHYGNQRNVQSEMV